MRQFVAFPLNALAVLPRVQSDRKRQPSRTTAHRTASKLNPGVEEQKIRADASAGKGTAACKNRNEELTMIRYEPLIPRVAFGTAAVAMAAITIGVSVDMPTKMDSDRHDLRMLAALEVTALASTGVATGSESIDLIALHEAGLSTVPCTSSHPNPKPEG
jgi:hypothetical protein